eukprot:COSAG05_NODE_1971_length_3766_cov_556.224434_1_plen_182_part_00
MRLARLPRGSRRRIGAVASRTQRLGPKSMFLLHAVAALWLPALTAAPTRGGAAARGGGAAGVFFVDPAGLPLALLGSYSAEAISSNATNINEFKLGPNTAIFAEEWVDMTTGGPSSVQSWEKIETWLDRCDTVGASVLFPLTLPTYMMFTNKSCCDAIITGMEGAPKRSRSRSHSTPTDYA